ncbi:MAG: type VI secretion system ATPase TssH, partial [Candidatus Desantisbacteria bacterium]
MITRDIKALMKRCNPQCTRALEASAGFCIARAHYEVTFEHLFLKLLEEGGGDIPKILRHFEIDAGKFQEVLLHTMEKFRTGNAGRPTFSPILLEMIERAWMIASVEYGHAEIRSGILLVTLATQQGLSVSSEYVDILSGINEDELRKKFPYIVAGSQEDKTVTGQFAATGGVAENKGDTALAQYCTNFTASARNGQIDPVFGRDDEIRQMIDILARRRKNNPILVGEAGVGKTAVVEGFALRVVKGDIPSVLAGVEIYGLDLGLLQAGAGVKGEFENRLKSVIAEVKGSAVPIIMFIDEAHTLIGAGGTAGQGDAANLLKPALARGELRTVAATTWSEYKKYFEKDPALARRFQLVKVDEPSEEIAEVMLRGLKEKYEAAHKVRILDESIVAAVQLSNRFISGRQLPDKAVDLMDTAAARVKISLSSKPHPVDNIERKIENLNIEVAARKRDVEGGTGVDEGELQQLEVEKSRLQEELDRLTMQWQKELEIIERIRALQQKISQKEPEIEATVLEETTSTSDEVEQVSGADLQAEIGKALDELKHVQDNTPLLHMEVNSDVVAAIVSDWTGIPTGKMIRDQAETILKLEDQLKKRILGQDGAIGTIAKSIRASKAGLSNPNAPIGIFLLVGPSGTGKTETGLALADLLFGGERFTSTVNMSEYMEKHTSSKLIGSPPGYVGYGEGGVLTEAIRQRPYSVVLLDEIEKAHPDIMNLFYQVFDKGVLADGEGREIDFKNTVILMTSNLASEA